MSITAAGEATSPRTLSRVGAALIVAVCSCLFIVAGTNARPASAFVPAPLPVVLPGAVIGAGAGGGAVVAGAFLGAYYTTTAVLEWAFGPEQPAGSSHPTTTGKCSAYRDPDNPSEPAREYIRALCTAVPSNVNILEISGCNSNISTDKYLVRQAGTQVFTGSCQFGWSLEIGAPTDSFLARDTDGTYRGYVGAEGNYAWYQNAPEYTVEVVQRCRDANGVEVTATSTPYTFTPGPNTAGPALEVDPCPTILPDSHLEQIGVVGGPTGQTPGTLVEWDAWTPDAAEDYPLCTVNSGATASCQVVPKVAGQSCFVASVECGEWVTRTGHACFWGPYSVPDSWCTDAYGPWLSQESTLDAGNQPAPTNPGTASPGTTVTNPDGSTTQTQTQTLPDGTTRTVTTTTRPDGSKTITTQPTNPDGSPNGAPNVVNLPAPGTGEQTDSPDGNCMDGAFGWNPISWVYTPVKCALQWAFVPPPGSLEAAFGGVGDAWSDGAIGTFGGMLGDLFGPVGDLAAMEPDGCLGPLVTIPLPVGPDLSIRPLNVCSELAQYVLGYWMPAASAGIYLATFFGIYHGFGRALGLSTPVVRAKA